LSYQQHFDRQTLAFIRDLTVTFCSLKLRKKPIRKILWTFWFREPRGVLSRVSFFESLALFPSFPLKVMTFFARPSNRSRQVCPLFRLHLLLHCASMIT